MPTDKLPKRKLLRLREYDYRTPGTYFVTICTDRKQSVLARIYETHHELTDFGRIALQTWHDLPTHFPRLLLDTFIIMPNHVHGILTLQTFDTDDALRPETSMDTSLSTVISFFKSDIARKINAMRKTPGNPVWQRGFYDRILTTEVTLGNAREYIANNPAQWIYDRENPDRIRREA